MAERGTPYRHAPYRGSASSMAGSAVVSLIGAVLLLVIELISTMLLFAYLNLNHVDTFGWMVSQADIVRGLLVSQLQFWLPASSNAAYASLIGDFAPKAILLLIMGLVIGTVLRWTLALFRG